MKKIAVFLGAGFEELEAISVIDVLRRAGCEVVLVSVGQGLQVQSQGGVCMMADCLVDELRDDFDAIVCPGGLGGVEQLCQSAKLLDLLFAAHTQDKIIAAICAAPLLLAQVGLLDKKQFTCYPSVETKIQSIAKDSCYVSDEDVIKDGNIITSRGPGTALAFALALVGLLCSKQKEQEIKKGMLVA